MQYYKASTKGNHNWHNRIEAAYITTDALRTLKDNESIIAIISPGEPFHTKTAGLDWLINWYRIQEQSNYCPHIKRRIC